MAGTDRKAKPIDSYKTGDRVFAKMPTYSPWPGLVLERCATKVEKYLIFFYGSHDSADIKPTMMFPFTEENIAKYGQVGKYSKLFKQAMGEIQADVKLRPSDAVLKNGFFKTLEPKASQNGLASESEEKDASSEPGKKEVISEPDQTYEVPDSDKRNIDSQSEPDDCNADDSPMLLSMQHEPKKNSDADCVLRCIDGEILVHAVLFRNWLVEDSQNTLPANLEFKLKIWTIEEVAPIIIILYSADHAIKLDSKARQAFRIIQQTLAKIDFNIKIPQIRDPDEQVDPQLKFRCTQTLPGNGKKSCYYVVSTKKFIDACDECIFSGSADDVTKHLQDMHGKIEPSAQSDVKVKLPVLKKQPKQVITDNESGVNQSQSSFCESQTTTSSENPAVVMATLHPVFTSQEVPKTRNIEGFSPDMTIRSDCRVTMEDTIIAEKKRKVKNE